MASDVSVFRAKARHTLDELAQLARGPLEDAGAERALVFGSYARGSADAYSDLDLAVVVDTDLPRLERPLLLRRLLDALPVPVDLLVYTPVEWETGMRRRFGVFDAIARDGIVIHERNTD